MDDGYAPDAELDARPRRKSLTKKDQRRSARTSGVKIKGMVNDEVPKVFRKPKKSDRKSDHSSARKSDEVLRKNDDRGMFDSAGDLEPKAPSGFKLGGMNKWAAAKLKLLDIDGPKAEVDGASPSPAMPKAKLTGLFSTVKAAKEVRERELGGAASGENVKENLKKKLGKLESQLKEERNQWSSAETELKTKIQSLEVELGALRKQKQDVEDKFQRRAKSAKAIAAKFASSQELKEAMEREQKEKLKEMKASFKDKELDKLAETMAAAESKVEKYKMFVTDILKSCKVPISANDDITSDKYIDKLNRVVDLVVKLKTEHEEKAKEKTVTERERNPLQPELDKLRKQLTKSEKRCGRLLNKVRQVLGPDYNDSDHSSDEDDPHSPNKKGRLGKGASSLRVTLPQIKGAGSMLNRSSPLPEKQPKTPKSPKAKISELCKQLAEAHAEIHRLNDEFGDQLREVKKLSQSNSLLEAEQELARSAGSQLSEAREEANSLRERLVEVGVLLEVDLMTDLSGTKSDRKSTRISAASRKEEEEVKDGRRDEEGNEDNTLEDKDDAMPLQEEEEGVEGGGQLVPYEDREARMSEAVSLMSIKEEKEDEEEAELEGFEALKAKWLHREEMRRTLDAVKEILQLKPNAALDQVTEEVAAAVRDKAESKDRLLGLLQELGLADMDGEDYLLGLSERVKKFMEQHHEAVSRAQQAEDHLRDMETKAAELGGEQKTMEQVLMAMFLEAGLVDFPPGLDDVAKIQMFIRHNREKTEELQAKISRLESERDELSKKLKEIELLVYELTKGNEDESALQRRREAVEMVKRLCRGYIKHLKERGGPFPQAESHKKNTSFLPTIPKPIGHLNPLCAMAEYEIDLLVNNKKISEFQIDPSNSGVFQATINYFHLDTGGEVSFEKQACQSSNLLVDLVMSPKTPQAFQEDPRQEGKAKRAGSATQFRDYYATKGDVLGLCIRLKGFSIEATGKRVDFPARELVYNNSVLRAAEVVAAIPEEQAAKMTHISIWPDLTSSWRWLNTDKGWKLNRIRWRFLMKKVFPEMSDLVQILVPKTNHS